MTRMARGVTIAVGVVAAAIVLIQARFLTFYGDEWNFLLGHPGLLEPNNEHWATGLYLLYDGILALGAATYLPFMVALVVAHLVAGAALFALLRPRVGEGIAATATILLLVLGSAAEDLYWAWQVGFVADTAIGLLALAALERDRPRLAAGLLTIGLTIEGVGLFFLAAGSPISPRFQVADAYGCLPATLPGPEIAGPTAHDSHGTGVSALLADLT